MFQLHYIFLDFYYVIFGLSFIAIVAAFYTFLVPNIFYSVLWLILVYICMGIVFVLLGAEYVGLILMIVYLGAIAILFLFVIMLFDFRELEKRDLAPHVLVGYLLVVFVLVETCLEGCYFFPPVDVLKYYVTHLLLDANLRLVFYSDPIAYLGIYFFNFYFLYLLFVGLLLLAVLLGVVMILRDDLVLYELKQRGDSFGHRLRLQAVQPK